MIAERYRHNEVGDRLQEAYETLRRSRLTVGPPGYPTDAWPELRREWADLIIAVQAGHEVGWRVKTAAPSPDDVSRMEEALAWPMELLKDAETERRLIITFFACRGYYRMRGRDTVRALNFNNMKTLKRHVDKALRLLATRINLANGIREPEIIVRDRNGVRVD